MNEQDLFVEALQHDDPGERAAYLNQACAADAPLRDRVEKLLSVHERAGSFLNQPGMAPTIVTGPPAELPGMQIGRYKLLEQIGEGGMGIVFVAEQTEPVRRRVALKIIKPGMDTREVIARFEAERQALAMMDHPNIARIIDAGVVGETEVVGGRWSVVGEKAAQALGTRDNEERTSGEAASSPLTTDHRPPTTSYRPPTTSSRPYFVMELVRGMPITDYCDQARLCPDERLALFVTVCQAVQHAHQKGIIHRDLKPSNILATLHDGAPVPKVIDFGVAKAINQRLTENTIYTAFSQVIGTPLYMSPEQAALSGLDIDTRSDIYSLGVLLYELLTGQTPFDRDTVKKAGLDELRRMIREDEPARPSHRISTLGNQALSTIAEQRGLDQRRLRQLLQGELDWIVMKALEKDRNRRYESASALAADVERYLSDEAVHACPPSPAYRFTKFARRNKGTLITAAAVAAALVIGIVVSASQAVRATEAELQAKANAARAESSERDAKERLVEVEQQREEAERNFEIALEAVDRMLANVGAEELNEVARVGPLRRKILQDAVAFYERIPIDARASAAIRYRVAQTWYRIGQIGKDLDQDEETRHAYQKAITMLTQLIAEEPRQVEYREKLARLYRSAGSFYQNRQEEEEAAKHYRRSSALYAGLANDLKTLPELRRMRLVGTRVTPAGVEELRITHPLLEVTL